jgi:hypothetical protein
METRNHGRRARARWSAAGVIAVVLLVGACEGSNLFEGQVAEESPRVTLEAPDSVTAGALLTVQVTGTAPRGVSLIEVRFTGAAVDTVPIPFSGTNTTESAPATVTVGQSTGSAQITVTAFVQDVNGSNSQFESETVGVRAATPGPPN